MGLRGDTRSGKAWRQIPHCFVPGQWGMLHESNSCTTHHQTLLDHLTHHI